MAQNNFKAFATAVGANVLSQADWEVLAALASGFQSGKANSAQMNKAYRQSSMIAAMVGQFIANSGVDALDNGDVAGLVTKFTNALTANLRLGAGAPAIGIPFFWPSSAMPNSVMTEWADMVFLKFNGSSFSAATYPKLALVFPALLLPEARGEFPRIWDDGRGVDTGRALLSAQLDALQNITGSFNIGDNNGNVGGMGAPAGAFTGANDPGKVPTWTTGAAIGSRYVIANFNAANVARTSTETRSRNIAFNFLVRAK